MEKLQEMLQREMRRSTGALSPYAPSPRGCACNIACSIEYGCIVEGGGGDGEVVYLPVSPAIYFLCCRAYSVPMLVI